MVIWDGLQLGVFFFVAEKLGVLGEHETRYTISVFLIYTNIYGPYMDIYDLYIIYTYVFQSIPTVKDKNFFEELVDDFVKLSVGFSTI